jgi:hypothetical protein
MSVSNWALDTTWRDYFGMWNSLVEPQIAPLEASVCHGPRFATVPTIEQQVVGPSGKITYNFHLPSGSIVLGFWVGYSAPFTFQLTHVDLGHKLVQEPERSDGVTTTGADSARFPSFTLLPVPWPVVGDGLFTLELWANENDRVWMILAVGEVTDCPVR